MLVASPESTVAKPKRLLSAWFEPELPALRRLA
jgi:hypothetical protein